MNAMIAWWARNPIAANLLMLGMLFSGLLGYFQMEREIFPTIKVNAIEISIIWPGASPKEVEEQLLVRVEEALREIDSIDRISSTATEALGYILIEADPKIEMSSFLNNVKLQVDSISSFPKNIEPPIIHEKVLRSKMLRLAVHGNVEERELKRTAEQIRNEIVLLPGISIVELAGARREEISIELSEISMQRYQLNFDDIASAIRGASVNLSVGSIQSASGSIQLKAKNTAFSKRDFENIVVHQSDKGGVVWLKDIATVIDGFEEEEFLSLLNGEPSIIVQVMSSDNMDIVKASESINDWLKNTTVMLPEGVKLTLWDDSADIYQSRMNTISNSAFYGLILVFIVLFLFLNSRVALWVTCGIAVAFMATFALLPMYDVSINILSTFAFLLILGVVVDDAIVVGESIHDHSGVGSPVESAILGAQSVAKPVVFAVLTTMIAFLPWFFVGGAEARLVQQVSVIIVFALTFSLIEAFFILPSHLSKDKKKPKKKQSLMSRINQKVSGKLVSFSNVYYRRLLILSLKHSYITVSLFIAFFIISVGLLTSGLVKFSFSPDLESDRITVAVELVDGTPYSRTLDVLNQFQKAQQTLVEQLPHSDNSQNEIIKNWYTQVNGEKINVIIQLSSSDTRTISTKAIAQKLNDQIGYIPDAVKKLVEYKNNAKPALEYSISHAEPEILRSALHDFKKQLKTYKEVFAIRDDLQDTKQEIKLSLLPGAERLGFSLAEVSRQVRQAYYGEEAQRISRNGSDVKVMVRYLRENRKSLDSLSELQIRNHRGQMFPLLSIANIEFNVGVRKIERKERQRTAVISAELHSNVRRDILRDLKKNYLPDWKQKYPGVSFGEIGEAAGEKSFAIEIASLYLIAFFLMYALIAIVFKSYFLPLLIMLAIPFGFMGAVYGHLFYGVTMALFSYFGIGAAAGVVVNDNLVLIDYVAKLRDQGYSFFDSIVEAGVKRFRPIFLTSLTTFVGLIPLMSETSVQAQFLLPTVISLAFGVLFSTVVTLILVPSLYVIGHQWKRNKKSDDDFDRDDKHTSIEPDLLVSKA
ncbi:efflux RND transporter permease subunit [Aliikangiella sp. IMCC44359]|uniref:efflux RND transporter permease subunit n=1 Tax=Aliikangiella sp. IMCC44359 TaxID=3459125 RepID=UPI00403AE894